MECHVEQRRLGINTAHDEAAKKEGKCLSMEYKHIGQKLTWECKFGHRWEATLNEIRNGNTWCGVCYKNSLDRLGDAKKYAMDRDGECISDKYYNALHPLRWKCKLGHEWEVSFHAITTHGTWCKKCYHVSLACDIDECKKIAIERGGLCLSGEYTTCRDPLEWCCSRGHKWVASFGSVKYHNSWCPYCRYKNEAYSRRVLEKLFQKTFHKIKPDWLISPKTGEKLELDGFNESEHLAFEYNGKQHYATVKLWHSGDKDLTYQLEIDEWKLQKCQERDICLLIIPYQYDSKKKIDSYIIRELNNFGYCFTVEEIADVNYHE